MRDETFSRSQEQNHLTQLNLLYRTKRYQPKKAFYRCLRVLGSKGTLLFHLGAAHRWKNVCPFSNKCMKKGKRLKMGKIYSTVKEQCFGFCLNFLVPIFLPKSAFAICFETSEHFYVIYLDSCKLMKWETLQGSSWVAPHRSCERQVVCHD